MKICPFQKGLFTTAQAKRLGISGDYIARLLKLEIISRISHGVYLFAAYAFENDGLSYALWLSKDARKFAYERDDAYEPEQNPNDQDKGENSAANQQTKLSSEIRQSKTPINLRQLEKSHIFDGLSAIEIQNILTNDDHPLKLKEFKKNDIIFKAGERLEDIIYLEQGQLIVTTLEISSKYNIVHEYSAPCAVELRVSLSQKKTLPNDVVAMRDAKLYSFSMDQINSLPPSTEQRLMENLTHQLCDDLIRAENRIDIISEYMTSMRIVKYLDLLSTFQGEIITIPMTLSQLADFLRTSRSSLFKALGDLQDDGTISLVGEKNKRLSYKLNTSTTTKLPHP